MELITPLSFIELRSRYLVKEEKRNENLIVFISLYKHLRKSSSEIKSNINY